LAWPTFCFSTSVMKEIRPPRHHLARVLDGLGEGDEAERVLESAVEVARTKPFVDPIGVLAYADLVRRRRRRGADVTVLLAEARAAYPSNCVLLHLEGHDLIARGAYDEAVGRFDRVLAVDPTTLPADSPAYDKSLLGELSHDGRALALFKAHRYAEAAEAYHAAAALAPGNPAYPVKRRLAEARARRAGASQNRDGATD
jgi:tetratricopeptide (TPR) repeat protein